MEILRHGSANENKYKYPSIPLRFVVVADSGLVRTDIGFHPFSSKYRCYYLRQTHCYRLSVSFVLTFAMRSS